MSIHNRFIGTRNESSLHRTLKLRYAGPGGKTEEAAGEYFADAISADGEFIEVQLGSFAPLKKKAKEFAAAGRVRIIHPVAAVKKIEVYKPAAGRKKKGALLYRRKSPLRGSPWNIFDVLLYAPELPLIKGLTIEIVMADITEKRVKDGKGAWRRHGISILDRELVCYHESILLKKPADYLRFVPFKKKEVFTSTLLAESAGIEKDMARKALYVLTKMKIVKRTGKKGCSWLYVRRR
ncbi:MAG: replication protein [Treponema sp.]|nr:replication protein [Treponema sp.]